MKKFLAKSLIWILLSMLVGAWYGECLSQAHARDIDGASLTIRESLERAGANQALQDLTYVDNRSKSHGEERFFQNPAAEIEEELHRRHLNFFKKPISVCSYSPFLAYHRPNFFPTHRVDGTPLFGAGSVALSERYLIFQVLRI